MICSTLRWTPRCPANSPLSTALYSSITASQCHQRRHSSSKPPIPPNDNPTGLATSVKSVNSRPPKNENSKVDGSKSEPEKRSGAESRLGKRKGSRDSTLEERTGRSLNLPSVPNTDYLHEHDVSMASFFACHRPMSITSSVPAQQAPEVFSTIFSPNSKLKHRRAQVISVLGNAVQAMERGGQQQPRRAFQDQQLRVRAQRRDLNELLMSVSQQTPNGSEGTHHLDGNHQGQASGEMQFAVSIDQFAQQFRPFRVPPAPEPMSKMNFEIVDGEASDERSYFSRREEAPLRQEIREHQAQNDAEETAVYQAFLTVKEHMSKTGEKIFTAHASPLMKIRKRERRRPLRTESNMRTSIYHPTTAQQTHVSNSRTYIERRQRNRQIMTELKERTMHVISVKRQRKLKMKKHKHKKLMRKTRNLRRKLDKL